MTKKILLIILIIGFLFSYIEGYSLSKWDTISSDILESSEELEEEITPIRDINGKFLGLNIFIVIPDDYDKEEITITPNLFEGINHYTSIKDNNNLKVNLKIINKSKYDYCYIDNSFTLETDDITRYGLLSNFKDTGGVGFDGKKIYDIFSPYRSFNEAIVSLYGYTSNNDYNNSDLEDNNLDLKLKSKGYQGIDELDKYYLDYYNNKYNLKEMSLDQFTFSVINDMFSGEDTKIKETNTNIIELAYNYFYNKLLTFEFPNTTNNDEDYSIGSYMRNKLGNDYLKESLDSIASRSSKSIDEIVIKIDKRYERSVLKYYNLYGYMKFNLQKINTKEVNLSDGLIIPPNTDID